MIQLSKEQMFNLEKELIEYSYNVFDYFNGKINKYLCNLKFELNTITDLGQHCSLNNNVYIYINNILNDLYKNIIEFNIDDIEIAILITKYHIIRVIAHELSHSDQKINDICLYNNNDSYRKMIEHENDYNTYMYLINNNDIIEKELDFPMSGFVDLLKKDIDELEYKNYRINISLFELLLQYSI